MHITLNDCRDEREQRISDVEYISQAVRAKAEECLAAVDDGQFPSLWLLHCNQKLPCLPPAAIWTCLCLVFWVAWGWERYL